MMPPLPPRPRLLIRGAHVLTMDPTAPGGPGHDVLVVDGEIRAVGPGLSDPQAEVIDASRMIALPGLVATHDHLWQAIFRGVAGDDPRRDSWTIKETLAPHLAPTEHTASVRLACAEALSAGITTAISWSHNWMEPADADADLEGLLSTGIRARFAPGAPSTKWGLSLEEMDAIMARAGRRVDEPMDVADLERLGRERFEAGPVDGLVSFGVSVRGPARSTPEVVQTEFEAARAIGIPIYMHCAGTVAEVRRIRQVEVLEAAGLLGPDLHLAHGMQLSGGEIGAMAEHGVSLAVTPVSELRLELGIPPLTELRNAGVLVSLGFDSPAYSATMDMFATMRLTLGLERTRQGKVDALSAADVLRMATIDGARYLGLDDVTGSITPGKRADLILVRRDDINLGPAGLPLETIVFSAQPANVDTVVVDGRVLKRDGRLTALDPRAVVDEATAALRHVCERAGATGLLAA